MSTTENSAATGAGNNSSSPNIGRNVARKEGRPKVLGTALYADDMKFESVIYGGTVRSTVPRGKIREIIFDPSIPWNEFTIVRPEDIPGENAVTLIEKTQPFLATYIKHIAEPLALIAHPDRSMVKKALKKIRVVVDEEPAIFDIEESISSKSPQYGADNVFKEYRAKSENSENIAELFAGCDLVLEEVYETAAQEQFYIEPQGVIAQARHDGVTVWGSIQCPYYVQKALAPMLGKPADWIRVVQAETGGAFGGKEEYPNLLAGHAVLLSLKSGGKTVKMIYDRREDLWATTKRHPSRTRVKMGVKKDGTFVALEFDFKLNGGAYPTLSQTVLSRGILHSFGPYRWKAADVRGRVVMTNSNPYGAFRGFGAPQSIFATELHIDKIAGKLGIDPLEIRRRNYLHKGDKLPTGQVIKEDIDLERLVGRCAEMAGYAEKRKRFAEENAKAANSNGPIRRGIAPCVFYHGSGFTGSGEVMLGSKVAVRLTEKCGVEILSANVEYGQGTNTMFTQIAMEVLGLPEDWIEIHQPDTSIVPNSGPTVASRTTMIVGGIVEKALRELKATLVEKAGLAENSNHESFRTAARRYLREHKELKIVTQYAAPADIFWDDQNYRGEAYAAYSWSCNIAEVEVDMTTYFARCTSYYATVECGKVINPGIASGQIEGGIAQSVGFSLYEDCKMERGEMKNIQFTNYIIPLPADLNNIDVEFVEFPFSNQGPFHAKGIGELPADGPPSCVAAAVAHALGGVYINEVPILPEKIMTALEVKR